MLLPYPITGLFIKRTVVTASGTFTTQPDTRKMLVILQAGGGGGGGIPAAGAGTGNASGGGSAGGYLEALVACDGFASYACIVGAAGAAGANTGADGGDGGLSSIVVGPTTYTANGGLGGKGDAAGSALAHFTLGGASPSVSANGDVNGAGACGNYGVVTAAGAKGCAGGGARSVFGVGGRGTNSNGQGNAGVGFGGGGSGALAQSGGAAQAGRAGLIGVIVIEEYA